MKNCASSWLFTKIVPGCRSTKRSFIKITLEHPQGQKQIRLQLYDTLALPVLLFGRDTWAIREQDKYRMTSTEMNFMIERQKYMARLQTQLSYFIRI